MKISPTLLRRVETLEARVEGPAPRPEDRLSFAELAQLADLAPVDRQQLLRAARRRRPSLVEAIRKPDLDQVEAACPAGTPVTLRTLAELMRGAVTGQDRRRLALAFASVRDLDLMLAKQLHALATGTR